MLTLLLVLSFVGLVAPPAHADYTYSPSRPYRNHAGVSVWTPRNVDFNSGWDTTNNNAWFVFGFDYHQPQHKAELGQSVALEINAEVDCAWSKISYADSYHQGYKAHGWQTNIPAAALPYEDTIWNDPCVNHPMSGRGSVGIGVLNTTALAADCQAKLNAAQPCHYWARVSTQTIPGQSAPGYNSVVRLRTKVGVVSQSNLTDPPSYSTDCSFSDYEINTQWNRTDDTLANSVTAAPGLWLRMHDAGWCAWTDGSHEIGISTGTLYTGAPAPAGQGGNYYPNVSVNNLANQGLEENPAMNQYVLWSSNGGSMTRYCNDASWPAFDGACFVQYNNGGTGGGVSIYQDRAISTSGGGFNPTAEVAARCRVGASCGIVLAVRGIGVTADQAVSVGGTVPNDGHWYICRLDSNHPVNNAGFSNPHSTLRWEIYNTSNGNMDLDYTFLGGKTYAQNADNQSLGVGNADWSSVCTQK